MVCRRRSSLAACAIAVGLLFLTSAATETRDHAALRRPLEDTLAQEAASARLPVTLTRSDWTSLRSAYERARHATAPMRAGFADEGASVNPLAVNPIAQQAYVKASNTDPGDGF